MCFVVLKIMYTFTFLNYGSRYHSQYSNSLWTGSNPLRGRDFPHLSRLALGPTQPTVQGVTGLFPGGKVGWVWQ